MSLLRRVLPLIALSFPLLANAQAADQTLLRINSHGRMTLRLDGKTRTVKSSQLTTLLLKAGHPEERIVSIRASSETRYSVVKAAMDSMQEAGVTHISIVDPKHP